MNQRGRVDFNLVQSRLSQRSEINHHSRMDCLLSNTNEGIHQYWFRGRWRRLEGNDGARGVTQDRRHELCELCRQCRACAARLRRRRERLCRHCIWHCPRRLLRRVQRCRRRGGRENGRVHRSCPRGDIQFHKAPRTASACAVGLLPIVVFA